MSQKKFWEKKKKGELLLKEQNKKQLCKCGKKPVYFRRYEGRYYCKPCFCKSIETKFRKTVGKHRLVQQDDCIVFGLSGGKDSSVLLSLMHNLLKDWKVKLVAVSIDEGIKGYRKETLDTAARLCKQLGVKHEIVSFQKGLGQSLDKKVLEAKDSCTYCGVGRRYLLNKAARQLKATKLCVGHNLDDEAQSVLMNFLRGDLLRAGRMGVFTGEAEEFTPRIKPLRFIPEREIALYAILKGIPFSDRECPFIRGIRPEVREFLNEMESKYPGTKFSLLESYDKISPQIKKSVQYKGKLVECEKCKEPSSHKVCKTCQLWGESQLRGVI